MNVHLTVRVARNYSASSYLIISAVLPNQCPAQTPFLGVLSAMQDTSLPLTVHEFDEWGDPNASEAVEAMIRSYCPYENVREQKFPAMLISASVNDNR